MQIIYAAGIYANINNSFRKISIGEMHYEKGKL